MPSNPSKPYDLVVTPCIAWECWPDSSEYVLFLNVFKIKCNEVLNLTMTN